MNPEIVFVQHPPIHAVTAVADYARSHGTGFVIDAHSGAFLGQGFLRGAYRQRFAGLGRRALLTLVHNEDLIPHAEKLGLKYLVIEMAVPENPTTELAQLRHPAVVVVCGYGQDEPLAELLGAARLLPDLNLYLTGAKGEMIAHRVPLRPNVFATGFLDELDYWRLLNAGDVVVVLTRREATILSGAYEGLAAGKPLVLSKTRTLARAFPGGAVLVENDPESLAAGIREALQNGPVLARAGAELRADKAQVWKRQFSELKEMMGV